ncbi:MAG: Asp-tRNA(Asn)/Glu-tRNA(Gln) amidotransferase subunit GatA [Anaerofustis stercorihominis]|nr:Asp-tRNA(Asn)/Glu-tRNA(Gln) amidotransferase subunit GatA [Anaerofustis stercorihominis]
MQPYEMTVAQLKNAIKNKELSCVDAVNSYIDRINDKDALVNAYLTKCFDSALDNAKISDEKISKGEELNYLQGVPYSLKDNICTEGIATTCSSKLLDGFKPTYSAHVYEKLQDAGAILLGKVDMDEFAMGSTCENSAYGKVRNPFDLQRVPGGSSGGSAASVAAQTSSFSLGSDTGGSVRTPASYCSLTAIKPTYGAVSRYGLIAYASSLDQIGPVCRDITDAAMIMNIIAGNDKKDSTSLDISHPDYTSFLTEGIKGLKIGVDYESVATGLDEEVKQIYLNTIETFRSLGAEIIDVSFKMQKYAVPVYYLVACSEASSNLARFDGIRYGVREYGETLEEVITNSRTKGFGGEVKNRIMLGTYALSAGYYDMYYNQALKVRRLIYEDFMNTLSECDVFLCPTTPDPAYKIGEKNDDPMSLYLADIFTVTANLTGTPAAAFPAGFTRAGLPVGMQLSAKSLREDQLIKAIYNFQLATNYHTIKAEL